MPAGDAGLERQTRVHRPGGGCPSTWNPAYVCPDWHFEPTPGEHEASCVCCQAANVLLHGLDIEYAATVQRLQAQLAAQQAVVDAAREIEAVDHGVCYPDLAHALAALDKAQATQPEGERAG